MASKSQYTIKAYSKDRLQELNSQTGTNVYSIKNSTDRSKKLDVFKNDKKIASVGAIKNNGVPYMDYPTYIEEMGQKYANRRRKLYYERHKNELAIKDGNVTNSWWAKYLLW